MVGWTSTATAAAAAVIAGRRRPLLGGEMQARLEAHLADGGAGGVQESARGAGPLLYTGDKRKSSTKELSRHQTLNVVFTCV